jgi:DNA topoisomerase-1
MYKLVIVESPAKCSKIQGFLGNGYKVIASMGHIRKLTEDLDAVGLDRDFEAKWEFMTKEKSKAIAQLKDAAKSASQVYLASDADREGAAIAYAICLLLKLDPATTPRITFQEITQTAIQSAIQNPGLLNLNQVHAAEARAILDMMIGFTMSPLLWKAVGPTLSAGRCQTPALRLCVERETEIENFTATSSWKVHGVWTEALAEGSAATRASDAQPSVPWPAFLTDELEDEENATTYLEIHHNEPHGTVLTAETKPWSESAPLPLITSTLQQQASTLFRSPPKRTMATAQRLYEAGHITYMRTDKAVLSEEAYTAAQARVTTLYGVEYNNKSEVPQPKKAKGKKKAEEESKTQDAHSSSKKNAGQLVTQDAHEAIRPTHFETTDLPADEDWSAADRKIYSLIWQRAIQSVMAPVKGDQRTITFVADGDDKDDFQWRATSRKTTFLGWRRLGAEDEQEADAEAAVWTAMNNLKPAQRLQWSSLQADPHETKAPPRFTEASLVRELELKGIGRPSTFASLISTIVDKSYVETKTVEGRQVEVKKLLLPQPNTWPPEEQLTMQKIGTEKDRLVPTELGRTVLHYLLEHFDDLFAYTFTSAMESRLDKIAEGQEPFKQVLRDTWTAYKDRYTTLKSAKATAGAISEHKREFADGLKAVMTKKGPLLLREDPKGVKDNTIFYGWPTAVPFAELTEEAAQAFAASKASEKVGQILGEHEGHPITKKVGKFGPYVEWNGKTVSIAATDTLQQITEKLSTSAAATGKVVGTFEIRKGPYGHYMFKRNVTGPARKFVSVPDSIDQDTVTEQTLLELFQAGLKAKARGSAFSAKRPAHADNSDTPASSGARGRGRGGYRGRGGAVRGAARGRGRGKKE